MIVLNNWVNSEWMFHHTGTHANQCTCCNVISHALCHARIYPAKRCDMFNQLQCMCISVLKIILLRSYNKSGMRKISMTIKMTIKWTHWHSIYYSSKFSQPWFVKIFHSQILCHMVNEQMLFFVILNLIGITCCGVHRLWCHTQKLWGCVYLEELYRSLQIEKLTCRIRGYALTRVVRIHLHYGNQCFLVSGTGIILGMCT